jgi:hypothetical protein
VDAPGASRWAHAAAFLLAAALLLVHALQGGSYDVVVRSQLAILLWWTITLGAVLGVLPRTRAPLALLVAGLALAGLAVWTAASFGWSDSDERTTVEVARVVHHLGVLVLVSLVAGRRTWTSAAAGVAAAAALVCAMAFVSRLAPDVLVAELYGPEGGRRLSYPLNYWNANAAWGAMTLALLLPWSAHARSTAVRALALAAVPVVVCATYLTYSRAGVLGTTLAAVLVVALAAHRWLSLTHLLAAALASAPAVAVLRDRPEILEGDGTRGAGSLVAALLLSTLVAAVVPVLTRRLRGDRWRMRPRAARVALGAGVAVALVAGVVAGPALADRAWDSFRSQNAAFATDPAQRLNLSGNRYDIFGSAVDAFAEQPGRASAPGPSSSVEPGRARPRVRPRRPLALPRDRRRARRAGHPAPARPAAGGRRHRHEGPAAGARRHGGRGGRRRWRCAARSTCSTPASTGCGSRPRSPSSPSPRSGSSERAPPRPGCAHAGPGPAARAPGGRRARRARGDRHAAAAPRRDLGRPRLAGRGPPGRLPAGAGGRQRRDRRVALGRISLPPARLVLAGEGESRLARRDALRARRREPTNWRHPFVLAQLDAEAGRIELALREYRAATRLRPRAALFAPP